MKKSLDHPIRTTRPWEKYFSGEDVLYPRRMVDLIITLNLVGWPFGCVFLFRAEVDSLKIIGNLILGKY